MIETDKINNSGHTLRPTFHHWQLSPTIWHQICNMCINFKTAPRKYYFDTYFYIVWLKLAKLELTKSIRVCEPLNLHVRVV